MKLMLITANEQSVVEAQNAGVDRIFLDLEHINKVERQFGRSTLISNNSIEDVARLRRIVDRAEFLVRINPIHHNTKAEIDRVVRDGADILMLPMVLDAEDARTFVDCVGGRAKTCLLLETAQALARIDEILEVGGVDEIYIGLNDLCISMNLSFMFELLSGGIVEYMTGKIKKRGLPYGFGGIAKMGEAVALPAEMILAEHFRLGSSSVILSRAFRNDGATGERVDYFSEIGKIREREREYAGWPAERFEQNRLNVKARVAEIVGGGSR